MQPTNRFVSMRSGSFAQDLKAGGSTIVPVIDAEVFEVTSSSELWIYEARVGGLVIKFETREPINLRGRRETGVVLEVRPSPLSRKMNAPDRGNEYFIVAVNSTAGYIGLIDTTDA